MSTIAIYVLCFMLISSILGFLSAWAWKQPKVSELNSKLDAAQKGLQQVKTQHDSLQAHANQLEEQKQKLVYENERLTLKLSMLLGKSKPVDRNKSFIENDGFVDTSNLDQKINDLNAQIDKLNSEIDVAKRESLEWQVQYSEILKEKEDLAVELHGKRNTET
jgi:cell division protein FtsB